MVSLRATLFFASLSLALAFASQTATCSEPADAPVKPRLETVYLVWPPEEKWRVASSRVDDAVDMVELVREGETVDDWTQIGTMMLLKRARSDDVRVGFDALVKQLSAGCPDVRLATELAEPDAEFPRMIFSLECARTPGDGHPESAVWLVIRGRGGLYVVQRAVRAERLDERLRTDWVRWLKTAKVGEWQRRAAP